MAAGDELDGRDGGVADDRGDDGGLRIRLPCAESTRRARSREGLRRCARRPRVKQGKGAPCRAGTTSATSAATGSALPTSDAAGQPGRSCAPRAAATIVSICHRRRSRGPVVMRGTKARGRRRLVAHAARAQGLLTASGGQASGRAASRTARPGERGVWYPTSMLASRHPRLLEHAVRRRPRRASASDSGSRSCATSSSRSGLQPAAHAPRRGPPERVRLLRPRLDARAPHAAVRRDRGRHPRDARVRGCPTTAAPARDRRLRAAPARGAARAHARRRVHAAGARRALQAGGDLRHRLLAGHACCASCCAVTTCCATSATSTSPTSTPPASPHVQAFRHTLGELGVSPPCEAAHVGDIQRTDIAGAQAAGMSAVLFIGANNHDAPLHDGRPGGAALRRAAGRARRPCLCRLLSRRAPAVAPHRRLFVLLLLGLLAFVVVAALVGAGAGGGLDGRLITWIEAHRRHPATRDRHPPLAPRRVVVRARAHGARRGPAGLGQRRQQAAYLLYTIALSLTLNLVLKLLFKRQPPGDPAHLVEASNYAFPSGHTMTATALATALTMVAWPTRWRWPVLVIAGLGARPMGLSRVYLAVALAVRRRRRLAAGTHRSPVRSRRLPLAVHDQRRQAEPLGSEEVAGEGAIEDRARRARMRRRARRLRRRSTSVLLDWGDTLMVDDGTQQGPMADWPRGGGRRRARSEALRRPARATTASSSPPTPDRIQRPDVRAALARVGLDGYVDDVVSSRDVGARKPTPAFYRAGAARAGVDGRAVAPRRAP